MRLFVEVSMFVAALIAIIAVALIVFRYLKTPGSQEPHPTCYTCPAPGTIRARSELWVYEPWFCAVCFAIYQHVLEVTREEQHT